MNPFSGHLIDLKEAALPAGYDKVPLALERIAAAELAGRQETHVDLSKPTPLAEWAKKKRLARPDEKEGLQGPAIEDRARLLDALETIDIIWRHYVKPHTSDWRETEKAIKTIRAALGVEPDAAIRERT